MLAFQLPTLLLIVYSAAAAAAVGSDIVWSAGNWSSIAVASNGSMGITAGGALFARSDGDVRLHADGRWYSRSAGTMTQVGVGTRVSGEHVRLGAWTGWQTTWACEAATMVTTVKHFTGEEDTFVFEQRFPNGARNMSLAQGALNAHAWHPLDLASSQWPVFDGDSLSWKAQGWSGTMSCGTTIANSATELEGKYLSLQGGPILTFDEPDEYVENCSGAVFSTFDNFKSGIWANAGPDSSGSGLGFIPKSTQGSQCKVEKGVNYERHDLFGSDYSAKGLALYNTTKDTSGAECCSWCNGYSNCSAWTICIGCPKPYTDICFLKYSTSGRRASAQISGTRAGATPPPPDPPGPLVTGQLVAGVHGGITSLPDNHTTSFVLAMPRRKCRVETMRRWGAVMQKAYGTNHKPYHDRGPATSKLGYWTDNGAFYDWYHWNVSEILQGKAPGGKIPADTLIAVQQSLAGAGVPVRYYQLDAFWYYAQGPDWKLCAKDWIPEPHLFPNGLEALSRSMSSPLQKDGMGMMLYIPEVCANNSYSSNFTFYKSFEGIPTTGPIALVSAPESERFYGGLFDWGLANGAMVAFEIDFMDYQLLQFPVLLQNIGLAEQWQVGIGTAAQARNLSVQLCMEVPAELMTTLLSDSITNARGSGDGGADVAGFAASSLLMFALGISPFTDNFFSGIGKDGGKSASLRTALAIMSRGPVGFGDAVGKFNATLLKRTCTADGVLLQPSETAVQLDSPKYCADGCRSLVTSTVSRIKVDDGVRNFGIVMAFSAQPGAVPLPASQVRFAELPALVSSRHDYMYWRLDDPACVSGGDARSCLQMIDAVHPAHIVDSDSSGLAIFLVAPVMQGWVLLGEVSKLVPISEDRIATSATTDGGLSLQVVGAPQETVEMLAVNVAKSGGKIQAFAGTVGNDGIATIVVK